MGDDNKVQGGKWIFIKQAKPPQSENVTVDWGERVVPLSDAHRTFTPDGRMVPEEVVGRTPEDIYKYFKSDMIFTYLEYWMEDNVREKLEEYLYGRIEEAREKELAARRELEELIRDARSIDISWGIIGELTGMSRQAAHKRWSEKGIEANREHARRLAADAAETRRARAAEQLGGVALPNEADIAPIDPSLAPISDEQ